MSDEEIARRLTVPRRQVETGALVVIAHDRGGFEVHWVAPREPVPDRWPLLRRVGRWIIK